MSTPLTRSLANSLMDTATRQLKTSTDYKRGRFKRIDEAIAMMLGRIKPKLRQQFNIPLPVLSGLFDTFCADLDDPVQLKVKNNPGKNLKAVEGINQSLIISKRSMSNDNRWDYKDRMVKRYAASYGRGIIKYFTSAGPYTETLEATNPQYFHCQPRGGGLLERHLFCGEEGIVKTKDMLESGVKDGYYDEKGVQMLIDRAGDKKYQEKLSYMQETNNTRFRALGMDPDSNNYVGEPTFNLCEWALNHKGNRWMILFDPWTKTWIRCEKLSEISPKGLYPWTSFATHEDDELFWSVSILADIMYPVADTIITLINQDLTNRQKRNLNARLYDQDMVTNVSKLDEAQWRPDALVPIKVDVGSVKKLSDATFAFTTPELTGTIELVNWLDNFTGKQAGIYQNIPGTAGRKTNNVVYAEIQQMTKRVDYRSHSYTECWGEIVLRKIEGMKRDLSITEAVELLGPEIGFNFTHDLKEIHLEKDDIEIISTKAQAQEDALRKAQKEKALGLVAQDQGINQDWKRRKILLDIGGYEQDEVEDALDLRGQGAERNQLGMAEEAIGFLTKGREPETFYGATTIYQRKLLEFAINNRVDLGEERYMKFIEHIRSHNAIVTQNMAMLSAKLKAYQAPAEPGQGNPGQGQSMPTPPIQQPTPVEVNMQ